jgi:cytochrome b561
MASSIGIARYTKTAIVLHWLIAVLIICNVALALSVEAVPKEVVRPIINLHKSIGITVLGLAIMRLLWRFAHKPPEMPASYKPWERKAAHAAHWLLYLVIFALPLSGWAHDSAWKAAPTNPMFLYTLIPFPRMSFIMDLDADTKEYLHDLLFLIHSSFAYVLYVLLALHIGGALKHQFIDRQAELERMLP